MAERTVAAPFECSSDQPVLCLRSFAGGERPSHTRERGAPAEPPQRAFNARARTAAAAPLLHLPSPAKAGGVCPEQIASPSSGGAGPWKRPPLDPPA